MCACIIYFCDFFIWIILKSPDINRDIKLHIFLCLGDIALGCKASIVPYMDEIKKIFDIAFTAAIEIAVYLKKLEKFIRFTSER